SQTWPVPGLVGAAAALARVAQTASVCRTEARKGATSKQARNATRWRNGRRTDTRWRGFFAWPPRAFLTPEDGQPRSVRLLLGLLQQRRHVGPPLGERLLL